MTRYTTPLSITLLLILIFGGLGSTKAQTAAVGEDTLKLQEKLAVENVALRTELDRLKAECESGREKNERLQAKVDALQRQLTSTCPEQAYALNNALVDTPSEQFRVTASGELEEVAASESPKPLTDSNITDDKCNSGPADCHDPTMHGDNHPPVLIDFHNEALVHSALERMELRFSVRGVMPGFKYRITVEGGFHKVRPFQFRELVFSMDGNTSKYHAQVEFDVPASSVGLRKFRVLIDIWDMCTMLTRTEALVAAKDASFVVDPHHRHKSIVKTALSDSDMWRNASSDSMRVVLMGHNWFVDAMMSFKVTVQKGEHESSVSLKLSRRANENFWQREAAVSKMMMAHSISPRMLAVGNSWIIHEWIEAPQEARLDFKTANLAVLKEVGRLIATVHSIPAKWFDQFKADIKRCWPAFSGVSEESHSWRYAASWIPLAQMSSSPRIRDCGLQQAHAGGMNVGSNWMAGATQVDRAVLETWAKNGAWGPQHAVAKRVVTSHGDLHSGQIIRGWPEDGRIDTLRVIDLDHSCVTSAVHDLASMVSHCTTQEQKRAFLTGYLLQVGETFDDDSRDMLLLDCELAQLGGWMFGGKLGGFNIVEMKRPRVLDLVAFCQQFALQVRTFGQLQQKLLSGGLLKVLNEMETPLMKNVKNQGSWIHAVACRDHDCQADEATGATVHVVDDQNFLNGVAKMKANLVETEYRQYPAQFILVINTSTTYEESSQPEDSALGQPFQNMCTDRGQTYITLALMKSDREGFFKFTPPLA